MHKENSKFFIVFTWFYLHAIDSKANTEHVSILPICFSVSSIFP